MAILRRKSDGLRVPVPSPCLIGRSSSMDLRIEAPLSSSQHARLQWKANAWTVRDLGSRNGTYVGGERLEAGATRAIEPGAEIAFGTMESAWVLEDASPPGLIARNVATGALRSAASGMLALPSDAEPAAVVIEDSEGRHVVEMGGQAQPIEEGAVIEAGGEKWALHLPAIFMSTCEGSEPPLALATGELRLTVSRDEEQVEVALISGGRVHAMPPRAHYYLLLTLARARAAAEKEAALLPHERGWTSVDELTRMLGVEEIKLNVEVYRVRRDLAELGVVDAASIIERRRGLRTLRLGTPRATIVTAP